MVIVNAKDNTMRMLAALLILMIMVVGCVPKEFSTSEKAIYTTTRSLQAAKELRITALKTIGGMYINGTLTDPDFKADVIRIGDLLQKSINVTSEALEIYYQASNTDTKNDLHAKILLYQKVLGEFTDLVMPYVVDKLGD